MIAEPVEDLMEAGRRDVRVVVGGNAHHDHFVVGANLKGVGDGDVERRLHRDCARMIDRAALDHLHQIVGQDNRMTQDRSCNVEHAFRKLARQRRDPDATQTYPKRPRISSSASGSTVCTMASAI